jgi:DNA excision repair protein ERCC-4
MYRQSGLFSITSRILAVDMLLKRIPTSLISGILVLNAHT